MVGGQAVSGGSARSSAASTTRRCAPIHSSRSGAVTASAGRGLVTRRLVAERPRARAAVLVEDEIAARVLEQQLDFPLRFLQLGVAQPRELHALLVEHERFLERQ